MMSCKKNFAVSLENFPMSTQFLFPQIGMIIEPLL